MAMSMLLAIIGVGGSPDLPAGPLDAFRANLAAIQAEVDFEYRWSKEDGAVLKERGDSFAGDRRFGGELMTVGLGKWTCDATAERILLRVPEDKLRARQSTSSRIVSRGLQASEALMAIGEDLTAYHELGVGQGSILNISRAASPPIPIVGPLYWWHVARFPACLAEATPPTGVTRSKATRAGHSLDVEVYKTKYDKGFSNYEVSYEAALGYLPRFVRVISYVRGEDAFVKEMYLLGAESSPSGGFVPTEWYTTDFDVQDFESKYPNYDESTRLETTKVVLVGHFKAKSIKSLAGPVALDQLSDVRAYGFQGRGAPLSAQTTSITLDGLKSIVRSLENRPAPTLAAPHIDNEELRGTGKKPWNRSLLIFLSAGLIGVIVVLGGLLQRHRYSSGSILILAFLSQGCGYPGDGETTLVGAKFSREKLVYDPAQPVLSVGVDVINDGVGPVKFLDIDGGCGCRKFDRAGFPFTLAPHESRRIPVTLEDRRQFEPQVITLNLSTDKGNIQIPTRIFALPRHHISPTSLSIDVVEGEAARPIEIVHRVISDGPIESPDSTPEFPSEFQVVKKEVRPGRIDGAPEFSFTDTTYFLKLQDTRNGLHKSLIKLHGPGNRLISETAIVWSRHQFLASAPDRLIFGTIQKPIRAFLRCPDDSIELTKILSAPPGIKAVVSSPREVTVQLSDDAPGVIEGVVEVRTTAEGRPPLRIPVVRYAPIARK